MNVDYDTSQICLNGHVITGSYNKYPEYRKDFCSDCGEPTIIKCNKCSTEIQGYPLKEAMYYKLKRPNFCYKCGGEFPWMKKRVEAIMELIKMENSLNEEENAIFEKSIEDISKNTSTSDISASKLKILFKKLSKEAITATRTLIVEIASETVKKIITD